VWMHLRPLSPLWRRVTVRVRRVSVMSLTQSPDALSHCL